MKTFQIPFAFIFLSIFLFSCMAGEINDLHTVSPEGNREITISGSKAFKLDPIMVTVKMKTENGDKDFSFEFMAADINEETVDIDWKSNDFCDITFSQKDESKKIQHINLSDGNIEVNQELVLSPETEDIIKALPH